MSAPRSFAFLTLAALLGAGAAFAQSDAARDNAQNANPHSVKNKDRPVSDAPAASTKAQTQSAESANPDSTLNKDRTLPADADRARDVERAEKGNPHSVKNKDRMMGDDATSAQGVLEGMATADRGEVAMGKLAQENGSARLQQYGRMLQEDHGKSLDEVQQLAKKKSLTLAGAPKDAMAKHEMEEAHEMHGKLARLHGADFDKAFVKAMVEDHQKDIDQLRKWQTAVSDKEVSALIEKALPALERHLAAAQSLRTPAVQGRKP